MGIRRIYIRDNREVRQHIARTIADGDLPELNAIAMFLEG